MTIPSISGTSLYPLHASIYSGPDHQNFPRLRPFEDEVVSGEMRVQVTYEQYKVPIFYPSPYPA